MIVVDGLQHGLHLRRKLRERAVSSAPMHDDETRESLSGCLGAIPIGNHMFETATNSVPYYRRPDCLRNCKGESSVVFSRYVTKSQIAATDGLFRASEGGETGPVSDARDQAASL